MTPPALDILAHDFCEKHYLELARANEYPKVLEAMQIGAAAMAQTYNYELKNLVEELKLKRLVGDRPQ